MKIFPSNPDILLLGEPSSFEAQPLVLEKDIRQIDFLRNLDGHLFPQRVQNPNHIVPIGSFEHQQNWPTPGARKARPGEVSEIP